VYLEDRLEIMEKEDELPKRYFPNDYSDYHGTQVILYDWKPRIKEFVKIITTQQSLTLRDCDGGLYVGLSGISYVFWYLAHSPHFTQERVEFLKHAQSLMQIALQHAQAPEVQFDPTMKAGFLLGNAGVYAVASALYAAVGDQDLCHKYLQSYASAASHCQPIHFLRCGGDELFVGRAGFICGALWLRKTLGIDILPQERMFSLCDAIIQSGREYSLRQRSPVPLMYAYYDTEYLGAAHGISAILQMLMSVPDYLLSRPDVSRDVKTTLDFLTSLQQPNGNYPCAMDELGGRRPEPEELIHWCHGAPGVVYMLAKAYLVFKEDKYLHACLKCGEITWQKGQLRKGPGICHGVGGSGYVFLLLYRLTGDQRHLHRAQQFASFIFTEQFQRHSRQPDCPYSLFEGLAGTVCFLVDLMQPEKASFPFFDIFS